MLEEDETLLKKIGEEPFEGTDSFAEPILRVPGGKQPQPEQMIECIDKGSDSNELMVYNIEDVDRAGTSSEELGEYSSMLTLQQHPKQLSPMISCSNDAKNLLSRSGVASGQSDPPQFSGDRFIPCRPADQCAEGAERFLHEENQLLGGDIYQKRIKRNRANSNLSDVDSQNSTS